MPFKKIRKRETMTHPIDSDYIIATRRELHQCPELAFDLPQTVALVKRELERMGIPYTEAYGRGSVVATINAEKKAFTIGIRGDMDALPIEENTTVPYRSRIAGHMHACGHDAHTAMLLGTAQALESIKDQLNCRIRLLFQPSEEGRESGARVMADNGVMDDIDVIIGQHVNSNLPAGTAGVCAGLSTASSRTVQILFHGKTAHASLPHQGIDAMAMAVRTYSDTQLMLTREINPLERHFCMFGKLTAGTTQNVVAENAELLGTIRACHPDVDRHILKRVQMIARHAAEETGGTADVNTHLKCLPVYNDAALSDRLAVSAAKVVGPANFRRLDAKMSSEDFSQFLREKPGVFFHLGTRNEAKGITSHVHHHDFLVDEDALAIGSRICVQFVLDNMDGIPGLSVDPGIAQWLD